MNKLAKILTLAAFTLGVTACDLWSALDRRDIAYTDAMCQPGVSGACP